MNGDSVRLLQLMVVQLWINPSVPRDVGRSLAFYTLYFFCLDKGYIMLSSNFNLEIAEDLVVERNRQLLLERSKVGISKYGVTVDGNNLTEKEWLQHALEEALDLANYIQKLILGKERQELRE